MSQSEKEKILVPIDFSEYSKRACRFAFNIAQKKDAYVVLLHAYFSPLFPNAFPDNDMLDVDFSQEETALDVKKRIDDQVSHFSQNIHSKIINGELPNVEFEFVILEGIPEEEINRWSRQNNPSLIVMGTRGKDQKELDLIGSVTAEVIDTSKIPVFAIPEDSAVRSMADIHRIAYLTDFDQRDLYGFDKLMNIEGFCNKPVSFIYLSAKANPDYSKALEAAKMYFSKNYPSLDCSFGVVDMDDLLNNMDSFIEQNKVDLLVLTTHKRNIFARLFNPSIAHKMVFHTKTPLLVIRD